MFYESFLEGTEPPETAASIPPAYKRDLFLSSIDWKQSVNDIFVLLYNSTGEDFNAALPAAPGPPNNKLLWKRKRTRVFESPTDFYGFRQIRSEHLIARMRQNFTFTDVSLRRVSTGLYIVHKERGTHAFFGIDCSNITAECTDDDDDNDNDQASNGGQKSNNPSELVCRKFKPYSYTVGLRYTMPFQDVLDILMYAPGLPLYAQAVFLKSCIEYQKEFGAFQVGMPYTGLFPFAPHVKVSFLDMPVDHLLSTKDPCPSVLLIFEKFAMEVLCDPEFRSAKMNSNPAKCGMYPALWCNSDLETNKRLTVLAEQWRQSLLASNDNTKYDLSMLQ